MEIFPWCLLNILIYIMTISALAHQQFLQYAAHMNDEYLKYMVTTATRTILPNLNVSAATQFNTRIVKC